MPIVIAGGPRVKTERQVFEFIHDGMKKGAVGQNLGRNIWQHKYPIAMIKALRAIIHDGASVNKAQKIFEENAGTKSAKRTTKK